MAQFSRKELYEKVWETPMESLAEEFGMTGRGLSKLCKRHEIPTPPRGYWAKVHAGQKLPKSPLLKPQRPQPRMVVIQDRRPEKKETKKRKEAVKQARAQVQSVVRIDKVPADMRGLHWIVARWVAEHKAAYAKAKKENNSRRQRGGRGANIDELFGRQLHWGAADPKVDLTERDRYRFRMTSAFLKGIEANAGKALDGSINGELKISCSGQEISILVKEKMLQDRRKPSQIDKDWTAYPGHHNAALRPSGYLRINVKTYVGGGLKDQWIETDTCNGGEFLSFVLCDVLAMGPILVRREEEAEENRRQALLEQQRRLEIQHLARLEAERWEAFKQLSTDWEEVLRLRRFLDELQSRPEEFAYEFEGMTISEYLEWARQKIDELDPFVLRDQQSANEVKD